MRCETNPAQAIAYLAKDAGVDLRALAGGHQADQALRQASERATRAESIVERYYTENEKLKAELAKRDQARWSGKKEQERQVKEARRQAPFAQAVGPTTRAKSSFDDTLRRNVNRVLGNW